MNNDVNLFNHMIGSRKSCLNPRKCWNHVVSVTVNISQRLFCRKAQEWFCIDWRLSQLWLIESLVPVGNEDLAFRDPEYLRKLKADEMVFEEKTILSRTVLPTPRANLHTSYCFRNWWTTLLLVSLENCSWFIFRVVGRNISILYSNWYSMIFQIIVSDCVL